MTTWDTGVRAPLADGEVITIRPLSPNDADDVFDLHRRLSARDKYFRYFGPEPAHLDRLAARIAAEPGPRHTAIGAYRDSRLIGVAYYEAVAEAGDAEIALAVDGAAQAHGVATLLLEYLVSAAKEQGVRRFVAEVLAENTPVIRVLTGLGLPVRFSPGGPERDVVLSLADDGRYADAVLHRELVADTASLVPVLRPSSVAVIGAGRRPGTLGHELLRNVLGGFAGTLTAINPKAGDRIAGVPCAASLGDLPEVPELAVLCVPAERCADVVRECGERGVRAVVVISAGLTGTAAGRELLDAVRRYGMRMVGPNCLGVATTEPGHLLNATFLRDPVPVGEVGVVTQSGGVGIALADGLAQLGLGLSNLVSTGDKYDVSGNDLLLWWLADETTRIAVLYLESFGNPAKFSSLARTLAREKPLLAVRSGTGDVAQAAAASHTAAAATPAVTRDALYEQAGVIAVDSVAELLEVIAALSWQPLPAGSRVAVVSNAGGAGVLAADACERWSLAVPELSPGTVQRLRALLPASAGVANPLDTTAAVPPGIFVEALRAVLADDRIDAVIAITVPTAVSDPADGLAVVVRESAKPVLAVRPGQAERVTPLNAPDAGAVTASYDDPGGAAAVLGRLSAYAAWRRRPEGQVHHFDDIDADAVRDLVRGALAAGGGWLPPDAAARLLRLARIPLVDTRYATTDEAVLAEFDQVGGPAVLKADAIGLLHKSAGGGVITGIEDLAGLCSALRLLRERFGAALRGVVLQPMIPPGRELLIGVRSDEVFGPLVVFGLGGVDTDLVADRAARLASLTDTDAGLLLDSLRSSTALWASGLAREGVREVLLRVSALATLVPEITELDLNPVTVSGSRCLALDVRVRIEPRRAPDPLLRAVRS
ncbi:GNAT family N-acetyltransferase [Amycolatopsis sp. 195334CR]|uniref:bifunctional acetate--CoA ligase family protein/GNAT family N-acetyltransferase n=1 Tax=Amycolatopsis sp. 195334CR TaxID=2814588 RepID=UPI001A8FA559|nr:GNAT family N-acetyltransferase [Amycolatopsis sp. 195334CR]MBN6040358.1 GNAT family N-acetyltransferase [Amycolatopsis sp. 195334CR]